MIKKYLFLALIIFLPGFVYSQNPENIPISSAEKFNRRGFINNDGIQVNGKEIISDYDGNLMLQYSTPLDLMSSLSGDFTVIYNANIDHKIFTSSSDRQGLTVNFPEWIMGYKGFAVQVMNFERHFDFPYIEGRNTFYGQEIPLLIPGYHFSNNMEFGTANTDRNDFITILKADGSKLILTNVESDSYTGIYLDRSPGNNGFAIVKILPEPNQYQKREIWYKPGDGLSYYFEEEYVDLEFKNPPSGQTQNLPKAAILKKIIDNDDHEVQFIYSSTPTNLSEISKGRKLFSAIRSTRLSSINDQLGVFYQPASPHSLWFIRITNHNYGDETLEFRTFPSPNVFWTGTPLNYGINNYVSNQFSRCVYFNEVIHNGTRKDTVKYFDSTSTNYIDRNYMFGISDNLYFFTLDAYLIKEVNYFNDKKTQFSFYSEAFKKNQEDLSVTDSLADGNIVNLSTINQVLQNNTDLTYRDCFSNFMIKEKRMLDDENNLIYTDHYLYEKEGGIESIWDYHATGVITKIINTTAQELPFEFLNTPLAFTTIKN